ncbi:3-hydroxyacyl-CoA dehydrogenase [Nordella sp. HKS 07]|uniref:3-hydroxyacyl-CoA dehydrogenase NAD-binding domain-containing protein n=1 Tax=Nordella sp. HKS 07 TaxID=2712222 RepID=UPI0013E208A9|nr:3-hydroxyacyl-CoA dehydrogenase NAD-binding domain-containing protein [Nordella sp. HKS 07]QIG47713.1 3-hydroxyacyl-CoA dehydrogenase [Nordella sp. HKS 07]
MPVSLTRDDGIAVITIDNPPVNAASHAVRQGLADAIAAIAEDKTLRGVILACAGKTFVAGADIREFGKPPVPPSLRDVIAALEALTIPVVAAIHGTALGGGFELALGCHYRVMDRNAFVGLPEVTLGIIPGAGGTQRLPRLIGMAPSIDMITSGRRVPAKEALELGIADNVAEHDLLAEARAFIATKPAVRRLCDLLSIAAGFTDAHKQISQKARGQASPLRALDVLEETAGMDFAQGMAREAEVFAELRNSDQARALRYIFFAEREIAKIPEAEARPVPVAQPGIIGGGLMGTGIAAAALLAGLSVILVERDRPSADLARDRVLGLLRASVERGKLAQSDFDRIAAGGLRTTAAMADLSTADLVIEAAFEDLGVKQAIFRDLDSIAKPEAILATNTSYLDVGAIADVTSRPKQVIGLHFFSPAHIMKLLEVVVPPNAAPETVATGFALARKLGKIAVRAGVCDGFIGNRILSAYRKQAEYLMEDGAAPAEIDAAFRGFGLPMGVFEMQDMAGLDIVWANRKALSPRRDPRERYVRIVDLICERGRFGRKTGSGYYNYAGKSPVPDEETLAIIAEERRRNGVTARGFTSDEIMDRILLAMINEGARILDEGIALRPGDIDVVMVNGYGFPRWRGGPMFIADEIGVKEILRRIEILAREDAWFWRPSALLIRLAEAGGKFAK